MMAACWILAIVVAVPFAWLAVECVAALCPPRRSWSVDGPRGRVAVLIPAHDEEAGIATTLTDVRGQLAPGDRVVVVADNCSDATAEVARTAGAEVVERSDAARRGKGYALDFGVRSLAADPPDVVIVIDADTRALPGAIDALRQSVTRSGRPAQALNTLDAPAGSGPGGRLSSFAFFFRNAIRARGMDRLGLPCLLYGTGMALPWDAVAAMNLANSDLTEDMRLGIDFACQGRPAVFVPAARVTGLLPVAVGAARSQRRRWEHGHIATILRVTPRLLMQGLARPRLLGLALHLSVPPLALLAVIGVITLAALAALGATQPALVLGSAIGLASAGVFLTWVIFARDRLSLLDLALLPVYVARKVPIYLGFVVNRQKAWVRTARDAPKGGGPCRPESEGLGAQPTGGKGLGTREQQ